MEKFFSFPEQLLAYLQCPSCKKGKFIIVAGNEPGLLCQSCKSCFPLIEARYVTKDIFLTPSFHKQINSKGLKKSNYLKDGSEILLTSKKPGYSLSAEVVHEIVKEELPNQGLILDSGCGNQGFKYKINNPRIIGTEYQYYENAFYPINILEISENTAFKNETFDFIISNFVLQSIYNQQLYVNELARILKKNGKIVLSTPSPRWYLAYFLSPSSHVKFLKDVIKNPFYFIASPIKFFLKSHAHNYRELPEELKSSNTLRAEIRQSKKEYYEGLFSKAGLRISKMESSGNVFSLNTRYSFLGKLFKNRRLKKGIHYTYVLKK